MTRAPALNWEQLALLPISLVTAEMSVHLDGPRELVQIGWRIRDTRTDECIGMGAHKPARMDEAGDVVRDAGAWLLATALEHVSPF